ncbi:MAG: aldehyde dehydrogenase [Actinomycetota bacterium]|nr:aldehyde dehydrogenase [Actinomycetota bacterium]
MQTREHLYIGGEWVAPSGTDTIDVISPYTEQVIARVPDGTTADIDRAVAAARAAFDDGPWPRMTPQERAGYLGRLSALIQSRMDEWAGVITSEVGAPFSFSQMGQVFASTMIMDYYTGLASTYNFEEVRAGVMGPALIRREPLGVAGAIVPWNVPLFTTALKLAPAFIAGCTMVLKPAPETPLDAYMLAEACEEIGLPKGVLNIVVAGREVSEHLVRHPDVDKIGFTGSTAAGRRIASVAGEGLKRVTLELGGKSAAIFMADADLAVAVPQALGSGFMNNGQACVAQTRILVSRDKYSETVDALVDFTRNQVLGDPMDPATQIGPLIAERQRERVEGYIAKAQAEGNKIAVGGGRPSSQPSGWFVEPTLVLDVNAKDTIAQEEVFGPVVSVIAYDSPEEAIRIANDSDYGLSGSVFTADVAAGIDVARQVRTGTYTVNSFALEFAGPFGGYKSSGVGRELGPEGLSAYMESKSISLPPGTEVPGVPVV